MKINKKPLSLFSKLLVNIINFTFIVLVTILEVNCGNDSLV
jgi:hypothetical protein